MGWPAFFYWLASLLISEALRPKIKVENATSASMDETNMPVASATAPVPVVVGKVRIRNPNVVWYGDYFALPVQKRAGKGGFMGMGHTIWQTVAYKYYFGQQLVLSHGPVTLHKIWSEERLIWDATTDPDHLMFFDFETDEFQPGPVGYFRVEKPSLYGGDDSGGGFASLVRFYDGSESQTSDPYLVEMLTHVPTYRGIASIVLYGPSRLLHPEIASVSLAGGSSGYIGLSPTPKPLSFEVSRYPSALTPSESIIGEDANPVEFIYECLTTDPNGPDGWGMGLPDSLIDLVAFRAAAHQCYVEGFGISLSWDQQGPIEEMIKDVCSTIDASCFRDFRTGKYTIKLIRDGYDVEDLPVLDVNNILEMDNFARLGIDGTTNEVTINYLDRTQDYKSMPALAQDLANMRAQGEIVSRSETFGSITTAALADRVANRELLAYSSPLARADVVVNRKGYAFVPGDLCVLTWAPLGIESMVMRVTKSAIGLPTANRIRLSLVQDVFRLGSETFMVGGGSQWQNPVVNPQPIVVQKVVELPYYFNSDAAWSSYAVFARRPNAGCRTFDVWEKLHADSSYFYQDSCPTFTPVGELTATYGITNGIDNSGTLTLRGNQDFGSVNGSSDDGLRRGENLAMFETGEFISFTSITSDIDGTVTLNGVWRGLFDTVPAVHSAGERIWFFFYGAVIPENLVANTAQIDVKNVCFGPRGSTTLDQATAATLTMTGRNTKPLPPGKLRVSGIERPATILETADFTWAHRQRSQVICNQSDADSGVAEGSYTVEILVGGVVARTYQTTGTQLTTGTQGVEKLTGLFMKDTNTFIVTTNSWSVSHPPSRILSVTSAGIADIAGSPTETGSADANGAAARFNNIHGAVMDSSGNLFVLDNITKIRKIDASKNVTTWMDLAIYGALGSIAIDGSNNIYVFCNATRELLKITPAKAVSILAGNRSSYGDINGTGSGASFSSASVIACDTSGNLFVQEEVGGSSGWEGTLRYCTSAGVVTTIQASSGEIVEQMAVVGSDLYYIGGLDRFTFGYHYGLRKCTPAGVVTDIIHNCESMQVAPDPGGHLAFYGYTVAGNLRVGRISAGGVVSYVYSDPGGAGYSPAMRIQDSSDGSRLVEMRIKQVNGLLSSAFNSSGEFQMTGLGMCLGQQLGGVQG